MKGGRMFVIHLQLANLGAVINLEEVYNYVKIMPICYDKIFSFK